MGVFISRKIEHLREYVYVQKSDVLFIKTSLFPLCICEIFLLCPIQYPNINGYLFYKEFGRQIIIPFSSILSAFCLLRVYFCIKLLKHLTRWTNSTSEYICEKYVCKANASFAFKAFQKENPFFMLFVIFVISCYCFGVSLQTFEHFYWENISSDAYNYQNWDYLWNAMWFVFVSMTTVGYGDFYPKTQIGRGITIFCCLVGVYFVSSLMVFMTNKTAKNEKEEKAFKLITRIKHRNVVKNLQSHVIHYFFKMIILKKK